MNRQVVLVSRPSGVAQAADFAIIAAPDPVPADGQVLVRNAFLSVEPAMRGWIADAGNYSAPVGIGEVKRALAVGTENLFAASSLTVFATYLAGLSNTAFTATQYALLSSVAAVGRTFATTPSGYVASALGWPKFYLLCCCLAIPGLVFLWLMQRAGFVMESIRQRGVAEPENAPDAART